MIHICTNKSLVAGGDFIEMKCPICLITSEQQIGYCGSLCEKCGNLIGLDEWMGALAYLRRKYLGSSRKDIARRVGLLPSTITYYENKWCSRRYYNKLGELVEIHNKQHTRSTA